MFGSFQVIRQIQSAPGPRSATFGPPLSHEARACSEVIVRPVWPRIRACWGYWPANTCGRLRSSRALVMSEAPQALRPSAPAGGSDGDHERGGRVRIGARIGLALGDVAALEQDEGGGEGEQAPGAEVISPDCSGA